jgi:hypothetical protein
MADAITGLLLELDKAYQSTVFSNLFVGIVFGELTPVHLTPPFSYLPCAGAYVVLYGTSLYILL